MGLPQIWEKGVPFFVIKLFPRENSCEAIEKALKPLKGREVTLWKLIETVKPLCKDIRVGLTFDPDYWYNPYSWSAYSYPVETVFHEIGNPSVKILPWSDKAQEEFWSYQGFGIVCDIAELKGDKVIEHGKPLAVAVSVMPHIPRMVAVFVPRDEDTVVVVTPNIYAQNVLRLHGYREIDKNVYEKRYEKPEKMYWELNKIDEQLRSEGLYTFMIRGLRRKVKEASQLEMIM